MIANMHETKSSLSKLVELVQDGEEVVIAKSAKKRTPGILKCKSFDMNRFDEADEEIRMMSKLSNIMG